MERLTLKQRIGRLLIPALPVNRHVFDHFRLEYNACMVKINNSFNPLKRSRLRRLRMSRKLLVNIGCGPFGQEGWINLDLFAAPNITIRVDCRRKLPLSDGSCKAIHVEHFYEHLSPFDERPAFLAECRRCLAPDGILRIIVPDAEIYVRAYIADGWSHLNAIGCGGQCPEADFATKMQALNHVFLQGNEHYGGLDWETARFEIEKSGFSRISKCGWREGSFPGGPIDREQHRPYSLYVEAMK